MHFHICNAASSNEVEGTNPKKEMNVETAVHLSLSWFIK
jgi:hypothetical protein